MKTVIWTLMLCSTALPLHAQVKISQQGKDKISIEIDGKPFTDFYTGGEGGKPYLHPLRSVSGKAVTRSFPMAADVAGERHDSPNHRGLWFTHGDVNGYDFWATEPGQKSANPNSKGQGKVVLGKVDKFVMNKKLGTISSTHSWQTPSGETLLVENRKMTFYPDPQSRIIDFDVTLSPVVEIRFGDTQDGMFALRLAAALEEEQPEGIAEPKRTGKTVNGQNKSGEKNIWGKRSDWVDYSGKIDGEALGVAVFDHPSNPRYPAYWNVRGNGLLAANIFGLHDFERDPGRDAGLTLRVGQPLRFRYRVVIHPGDATSGVRAAYEEWAVQQ
ncbi:MAG: PmoA family protein [Candidatus Solibacter sp.]